MKRNWKYGNGGIETVSFTEITIIYLPASQLPAQVQWIFRSTAGRRLLVSFFRSTRHQGLEGHPLCNQQQQQQHPAHTAPVFVLMLRYITWLPGCRLQLVSEQCCQQTTLKARIDRKKDSWKKGITQIGLKIPKI